MSDTLPAEEPPASATETAIEMRASGDLPGAIRVLYDQLAQDIGNQELYTTLATMLAENGEFDRADRIFQRAFTAGLDTPGLRLNYAAFQASSGQDGNYVEVFRGMGAKVTHVLAHLVLDDPGSAFAEDIWRFGMAECNLARVRLLEGTSMLRATWRKNGFFSHVFGRRRMTWWWRASRTAMRAMPSRTCTRMRGRRRR